MRTVLYPGSFNPVTCGHLDIIRRAAAAFDRVVVGVLYNPQKPSGALPTEERLRLLRVVTADEGNVRVAAFSGLLTEAARAAGADGVLRGIRGALDSEEELTMARLNRRGGGVETIFMAASPETAHISATYVRQIAALQGDLRGLVPEVIRAEVARLFAAL